MRDCLGQLDSSPANVIRLQTKYATNAGIAATRRNPAPSNAVEMFARRSKMSKHAIERISVDFRQAWGRPFVKALSFREPRSCLTSSTIAIDTMPRHCTMHKEAINQADGSVPGLLKSPVMTPSSAKRPAGIAAATNGMQTSPCIKLWILPAIRDVDAFSDFMGRRVNPKLYMVS